MCIYCLQTSEEEYYATGQTGTISELGRKISMVEEDLNYFAKHVFIYTDKMRHVCNSTMLEILEICVNII